MAAAFRIVLYQTATALLTAAGLAWVSLEQSAAALLAGAVCVLPNAYYTWRMSGTRSAGRLLGLGAARVLVTLTLMGLVFATAKPAALGFFAAFIAMQLMYVVGAVKEYEVPSGQPGQPAIRRSTLSGGTQPGQHGN
jgi:ATP synthase protein I